MALPTTDATKTTVTSSVNPSAVGQSVTFTATVTDTNPQGQGTPTGSVQFQIDGRNYGSPVTLSGGTARISDASLTVRNAPDRRGLHSEQRQLHAQHVEPLPAVGRGRVAGLDRFHVGSRRKRQSPLQ